MIYPCKFADCHSVFNRPSKLKRHEDIHKGLKSFTCSYKDCSKSYFNSSHLKRHVRTSHCSVKNLDVSYACSFPACNAVFSTTSGLQKHERKHVSDQYCNICKQFYRNEESFRNDYLRHQNKSHLNSKVRRCSKNTADETRSDGSYQCEECRITFPNKVDFMSHCKTFHEPLLYTFYCGESNCNKSFRYRKNLVEHIRYCHNEAPVFVCGEYGCPKIFHRKRNLRKHMRNCHAEVSQFVCGEPGCSKTFRHKKNLRHHIRNWHGDASVFICGESGCTKIFRHKRNLTEHIKAKHLEIVQKCPFEKCSRIFYFKKSWKCHVLQHLCNEKPFVEKEKKKSKEPVDLARKITFSLVKIAV